MTNLRWRFIIILAMVVLSIFALYPPEERVHLGLDLKGGMHLVMEVAVDEAVGKKVEKDVAAARAALTDSSIPFTDIIQEGTRFIRVMGLDPEGRSRFDELLPTTLPEYAVQSSDSDIVLRMDEESAQSIRRAAVQQSLQTLRRRVDQYGVAEPNIQTQGIGPDATRILVQLPGVEDQEEVKDLLGTAAVLEFKLVHYPPGTSNTQGWFGPSSREALETAFGGTIPSDTEILVERPEDGSVVYWPLKIASVIDGSDLKNAQRGQDEFGKPVVDFMLTPKAGKSFEAITRANVGNKMAIVLDDEVLSAPVINSTIADRGQIESNFTLDSADLLALQLKSGSLPASINVLEQRTVGPSLGLDSIRQGILAAGLGFGLVLVFMLIYYKLSGVNAIVALLLNLLLVLAVMSSFNATLTLPGIAGFILTIGMAVDANVLIFERIREELRNGKSVRASVDGGFGKAFSAIIDSNVTTLIAAVFLFQYGTGPIRGFAVTLSVGILASMVTALFVSRTIFMALLSRSTAVQRLSI